MVLANQTSVRGIDYVDVLSRANLHDSFSRAWGCPLEDHVREEEGLGSVSEDVIIEKTVAKAPQLWGFTVTRIDSAQPTFHLIPFTQDVSEEIKD